MVSNELILGLMALVTTLAGAWAYRFKRDSDVKLEKAHQEASEAKEQASQFTALTSSINHLADAWDRSSTRADAEREKFALIIQQNATAKSELASAVTDTNTQLKSLPDVFKAGATEAVKKVNDAMDTRFKETNEANDKAFSEVKQELSELRAKIDRLIELAERRETPPAPAPPLEVNATVTMSDEKADADV